MCFEPAARFFRRLLQLDTLSCRRCRPKLSSLALLRKQYGHLGRGSLCDASFGAYFCDTARALHYNRIRACAYKCVPKERRQPAGAQCYSLRHSMAVFPGRSPASALGIFGGRPGAAAACTACKDSHCGNSSLLLNETHAGADCDEGEDSQNMGV